MRALRSLIALLLIAGFCGSACSCLAEGKSTATKAVAAKPSTENAQKDTGFLGSLRDDKEPEQKDESVFVTALGFIARLALVLMLAYCTIWGLKRFTGLRSAVGIGRQRIRVVENANLAANRSLHLVEIGSKNYLVASTPNQVSLIAEIEKEDLPEADSTNQQDGFGQQLASFLGQKQDTTWAATSVGDMLRQSTGFLQDKVREVGGLRRKIKDA